MIKENLEFAHPILGPYFINCAPNIRLLPSLLVIEEFQNSKLTRQNMLFTPTLPVKAEFTSMLRMLSNAVNSEQSWEC